MKICPACLGTAKVQVSENPKTSVDKPKLVELDCVVCNGSGSIPTGDFVIDPLPDPRPVATQIEEDWGELILETCLKKGLK